MINVYNNFNRVSPNGTIFGHSFTRLFVLFLPKEQYPEVCKGSNETPSIFYR